MEGRVVRVLAVITLTLQAAKDVSMKVPLELEPTNLDESAWIPVPNAAGEWTWTHRKVVSMMHRKSSFQMSDVSFTLYTRQDIDDDGQLLELSNGDSIVGSNFRSDRPTRVIVHGWQAGGGSPIAYSIRDAYLMHWDYNVIVADWATCSMAWNYVRAVGCVPTVGKSLELLLDELNRSGGLLMETVYLIGHSLGAHAAGIAGKEVTSGQIHTIFALDPALPLFSIHAPANRINHRDAMYVEVIHTNAGLLGFQHPIGTADFYPNGGSHQPGCGLNIAGLCSHSRAWELFVETLMQPEAKLLASKVESLTDVKGPTIAEVFRLDQTIERVKMGGEPSSAGNAEGLYHITTRDSSPFFG
ncbi:lipase member I-like [Anopheles cruzii]|uniref:lipase member I-like n=1 Tax=Anopheles cruzii TaxID=68878 RepID=UPI0022EC9696|nr:lipase member I-like [Anopheles cruzii]